MKTSRSTLSAGVSIAVPLALALTACTSSPAEPTRTINCTKFIPGQFRTATEKIEILPELTREEFEPGLEEARTARESLRKSAENAPNDEVAAALIEYTDIAVEYMDYVEGVVNGTVERSMDAFELSERLRAARSEVVDACSLETQ